MKMLHATKELAVKFKPDGGFSKDGHGIYHISSAIINLQDHMEGTGGRIPNNL